MWPVLAAIKQVCTLFARDDKGVSAVEAAMVFPLLVTILCGSFDVGVALLVNQKLITSAQTVADLLAREDDVSDSELDEAVAAGRLALMPYPTASYGVDVAGLQFVGNSAVPSIIWRDTENMDENDEVLELSDGLGIQGEGVLAVTVKYTYEPYFAYVITGSFDMQESSYARGRRGLFVTRNQG